MNLAAFSSEMTRRGCAGDGKNFCGSCMGYPFTAGFAGGKDAGKTSFRLGFLLDRNISKSLYKSVTKRMKGTAKVMRAVDAVNSLAFFGGAIGAAFVARKINPALLDIAVQITNDAAFGETFDTLMRTVVEEARNEGYGVPDVCPVCKRADCDSYAYTNGAYCPVHAGCVQADSYEKQLKVRENEAEGSVFLGVVGAVLGAFVGMIPTVLLLVFANRIAAILCALIPYCAYWGYKIFRGKMSKAVFPIVVVISILTVPVVDYVVNAIFVLQDYNFFLDPSVYLTIFMESPADFVPSLLQTALFIGLGALFVSGVIRKNNSHFYREASLSAATLRPIDPTK